MEGGIASSKKHRRNAAPKSRTSAPKSSKSFICLGRDCKREKDGARADGLWIWGPEEQIRKGNIRNHVIRRHILPDFPNEDAEQYKKRKKWKETVDKYYFEVPQNISVEYCAEHISSEYSQNPEIDVAVLKEYVVICL